MTNAASDLLRADHRQIEDLLDRLLAVAKQPSRNMVPVLAELVWTLRNLSHPHFDREERIFYPRLRALFPDLLARLDEQHEYVREVERNLSELLAEIGDPPADRQFAEVIRFSIELHDTIQHHIVAEEEELLRLADARLSPAEQQALAAQILAENSASTNPRL